MFDEVKDKALKITEALYRTTDLFSDAEPLKWSLRQTAVDILNSSPQDIVKLEILVKNLLLKLELAAGGTFISKMNFDVLKREYSNLLSEAMSYKDGYQALLDNIARPIESEVVSDDIVMDKRVGELSQAHAPNNERREALLFALKQKGPSSVGALVGTLENQISEKTIQRELNAMVVAGLVKKDGEKRWRKYFI